ncbi:MAG: hypothetical protein FWF80_02035, partial [Defluviitaleaceae bacterium]|nr:hypothetical protein [Defluviitaleaceae bacterium]
MDLMMREGLIVKGVGGAYTVMTNGVSPLFFAEKETVSGNGGRTLPAPFETSRGYANTSTVSNARLACFYVCTA